LSDEANLETPATYDGLYAARDDETTEFVHRPRFTGDVLTLAEGRLVALVQHPCAMRRGAQLVERMLVCDVKSRQGSPPSDWSRGDFRRMFLPDLHGGHYAIEFDDLGVVPRDAIEQGGRIAILSQFGVNLLMQRWVHHNTRVVVPTITIDKETAGPYEEADLLGDACADLIQGGVDSGRALLLVNDWLRELHQTGGPSRQEMLRDPQQRSVVRGALRRQVRDWINQH